MSHLDRPAPSILLCGCRRCGCTCAEHSPGFEARACYTHETTSIARAVSDEAMALVAISLFIGAVVTIASLFSAWLNGSLSIPVL